MLTQDPVASSGLIDIAFDETASGHLTFFL
jgi:hypothetical protein